MSNSNTLIKKIGLPWNVKSRHNPSISSDKQLPVTGVIHNAGASAVWISPRNTFFGKRNGELPVGNT